MIRVSFTPNLQRHTDCPTCEVAGKTVGEALDAVFTQLPRLRGYILDDRGCVRKHVAIYVNNETIDDRDTLSDAIDDGSEIYVMQALSGG